MPAVATNVTPVLSADQPSTFCTYSVRMKKFAKTTAPSSRPATFAPGDRAHAEDAERHQRVLARATRSRGTRRAAPRRRRAARSSSRTPSRAPGAFDTA